MSKLMYKVEVVSEGAIGTVLLGASKLPVKKMEQVMNQYGYQGWTVSFMLIEKKRFLLFWQREAAVITFEKPITPVSHELS